MKALELRIPPPVVATISALLIWGISLITPVIEFQPDMKLLMSLGLVALGLCIILTGALAFKRASTTVNPLKPETSSALVDSGIYKISRNPMYVGLALGLLGWTIYLAAPVGLFGVAGFIWVMNQVQIIPEERVLERNFGNTFKDYKTKVRRWL